MLRDYNIWKWLIQTRVSILAVKTDSLDAAEDHFRWHIYISQYVYCSLAIIKKLPIF